MSWFTAWVTFSKYLSHTLWYYSIPSYSAFFSDLAKFWKVFFDKISPKRVSFVFIKKYANSTESSLYVVICYKHTIFGAKITDILTFFFYRRHLSILFVATPHWTLKRYDFCNTHTFPGEVKKIPSSVPSQYSLNQTLFVVHCTYLSIRCIVQWIQ